ncbi:hypothetical protein [Candidatus Vallotia cooleyia]|uniref:hypothetical protein n=1 Tax=Candidatus Vallotiella adelgis TaxID=1177211 RepID=UPI001D018943|nr:hypothetical protein [Candidatus Vallotia cooleyia]
MEHPKDSPVPASTSTQYVRTRQAKLRSAVDMLSHALNPPKRHYHSKLAARVPIIAHAFFRRSVLLQIEYRVRVA